MFGLGHLLLGYGHDVDRFVTANGFEVEQEQQINARHAGGEESVGDQGAAIALEIGAHERRHASLRRRAIQMTLCPNLPRMSGSMRRESGTMSLSNARTWEATRVVSSDRWRTKLLAHQPTPPIALKYIGVLETAQGRVAVFRDSGGDIVNGKEGDIIDGRYRLLKIGVESADLAYVDGRGRQTIRLSGQ